MVRRDIDRRSLVRGIGLIVTGSAFASVGTAKQQQSKDNGGARDGSTSVLTDAERAGLLFMREEEKLARDVYLVLYDEYGLTVFQNIVESEERHIDAMAALLDKYDLEDPATGEVGTFTNDELQHKYDTLVSRGRKSELEALRVGGFIEEIDAIDIQEEIDATDNEDIERVYWNLLEGSKSHLRAFVDVLDFRGVTYDPQVLDQATYEQIVAA